MKLASKAKETGIGLYFDAVLNHRAGADGTQRCHAVEVDENGKDSFQGLKYTVPKVLQ